MSTEAVERIETTIQENYSNINLLIENLKEYGFFPWNKTKSDAVLLSESEGLALFFEFDSRDRICRKYILCGIQQYSNQKLGFLPQTSFSKVFESSSTVPAAGSSGDAEAPIRQAGEKGKQIKEKIREIAKTNVLGLARVSQVVEELPYPDHETEALLEMFLQNGEIIEAQQGWLRVVGA